MKCVGFRIYNSGPVKLFWERDAGEGIVELVESRCTLRRAAEPVYEGLGVQVGDYAAGSLVMADGAGGVTVTAKPATSYRGPRPLGDRPMTQAERSKRHREKLMRDAGRIK